MTSKIPSPLYLKREIHQPLQSLLQKIAHFVVLLIGWFLYFYLIYVVFVQKQHNAKFIGYLAIIFFLVIVSSTLLWLYHDIRIFKRKGPRKGNRAVQELYDVDWNQQPIFADWDKAKTARFITIDVDKKGKFYSFMN